MTCDAGREQRLENVVGGVDMKSMPGSEARDAGGEFIPDRCIFSTVQQVLYMDSDIDGSPPSPFGGPEAASGPLSGGAVKMH